MKKEPKYFHINETILNEIWPIDVGFQENDIASNNCEVIKNKYPYFLLHYVKSGKCYVTFDGVTKSFEKGDMFVLFPQVDVEYYADKELGWSYYWINFNGTKAINILKNLGITREKYYAKLPEEEAEALLSRTLNFNSKPLSTVYNVNATLFAIFGLLSDAHPNLSNTNTDDFYVTEYLINYIQDNLFSHNLTAQRVAKHFYLNPKYFSTLFKKKFNVSFKEYVNYERIKKASELLETTKLSIKSISDSVGFNDNLYFSKVFKKYRLMSPSEYIEAKRQK